MDCHEALTTRRGVLRYDSRPVEPTLIEQVLAAAVAAPSPANLQPWAFVVVTEPELARRTAHYLIDVQDRGVFQAFLGLQPDETGRYLGLYDLFENAPCFIVVCNEPKAQFALPEHEVVLRDWYLMCLGAATANLMTAANGSGSGHALVRRLCPRRRRDISQGTAGHPGRGRDRRRDAAGLSGRRHVHPPAAADVPCGTGRLRPRRPAGAGLSAARQAAAG